MPLGASLPVSSARPQPLKMPQMTPEDGVSSSEPPRTRYGGDSAATGPAALQPYCNVIVEELPLDKVLPDRRALDKIVFETLGLAEAEQLQVYRALVELVKNRLVKAGSV